MRAALLPLLLIRLAVLGDRRVYVHGAAATLKAEADRRLRFLFGTKPVAN